MKKRQIYNKINQIDSINDKIDNILDTQYVESSGQYINMKDTSDGFSKAVLIEGNTHQNIYDGGDIKVQPNIEATDSEIYIPRSLEGELDKFSIDGKTMKNLATCERDIIVQEGETVEGRDITLNTVADGRVDDIVIKGVSVQNFATEDMITAVTQPIINVTGNKISIPDSYEGNLDFSEIKINGKTYNNLLREEFLNTSNIQIKNGEYTLTCVPNTYDYFLWDNVFLKDDTVYTIAFNVVSVSSGGSTAPNYPKSGNREFGSVVTYAGGTGYKKATFRTNKSLSEEWNLKHFTIWYESEVTGNVTIANPVLVEGDFSNIELPNKITGMESVNSKGNKIDISSYSQNLVDIRTVYNEKNDDISFDITDQTLTVTQNQAGAYMRGRINLSHLKPNTKYTLSADFSGANAFCKIHDFNKVNEHILRPSDDSITFTTSDYVSSLVLLCYSSYATSMPAGTSVRFSNIQIVEGEVKKPYVPFNKTSINIPVSLPLRSIGDLKDTIEKIDGEWYHVKRIDEFVLGRTYLYASTLYTNEETTFIVVSGQHLPNRKVSGRCQSNILPYIYPLTTPTIVESGCSLGSNLDIRLRLDLLGDIGGLDHLKKIDKAVQYLIDKGMKVLYELETPVLTKIEKPTINMSNQHSFITSSNSIKPDINISTTTGIQTITDRIKEYSVICDAQKLIDNDSQIKIEVAGVNYDPSYTFVKGETTRYIFRIIPETPNSRINFITPGFRISNVMVLEGYDADYCNFNFISGIKSVDKNIDITLSGTDTINKSIILSDDLRSLPNGVRDTIEKIGEKWYFVQRVGKKILNNSATEEWRVSYTFDNRFRLRTSVNVIPDFKYRETGRNYCMTRFRNDTNSESHANGVFINESGFVHVMIPKNEKNTSIDTSLKNFTKEIESNELVLLYELKNHILREINMPEIDTMEDTTRIHSCTDLSPIIKASTISRVKMTSMKPNTSYTMLFTANKHISTSNKLKIDCDGVQYSFTLGEGDNFIKHTFVTANTLNTKDVIFKTVGMKITDVIIIEGEYNKRIKPEYFRNVISSGENGSVSIVATGANIFKVVPYNRGSAEYTKVDDNNIKVYNSTAGTYCVKYFTIKNAKPNTRYKLDIDARVVSGAGRIVIKEAGFNDGMVYGADVGIISTISDSDHKSITFLTSNRINTDRLLTIGFYSSTSASSVGEVYYRNISLREYENIHYVYEKYSEDVRNITLTEPLRSLPDGTKDTIEQKEDGSWVVKRRIKRMKLSELGVRVEGNNNDNLYRCVLVNNGSTISAKPKTNDGVHIIADMFDSMRAHDTWSLLCRGIALNSNGEIDMVIEKSIIDSIGIDNWLKKNDGYIYYETINVAEEPIPELNKLKLFNYGTHITTTDKLADINIQNECLINVPLIESGKEYTIVLDINSSYSTANEPMRIYSGSSFAEINRIHTHKFDEHLKYYTSLTASVAKCIKLDNAGAMIKNLQIIPGNKISEYINGTIPFGFSSVGQNDAFKVKSRGKNLFNPKSVNTNNGRVKIDILGAKEFAITNLSSSNWVAASFPGIEFERDTPYTISYDYEIISGIQESTISVRQAKTSSSFSLLLNTKTGSAGSVVVSFTPRLQNHQVEIFVSRTTSNLNGKIKIKNFQIEKGTEKTSYEPYKENIISIPLPGGQLRKLPNGVSDTVEIIDGVPTIIRRVGRKLFNGVNEDWKRGSGNDEFIQFGLTEEVDCFNKAAQAWGPQQLNKLVSNRFLSVGDKLYFTDKITEGVCQAHSNSVTTNFWRIGISRNKLTGNNITNSFLSWLQNNPVEVLFELVNWVYEPIPDALLSLKAFNKFTHISGYDSVAYPYLSFKFAANLGAIIQSNNDRISAMIGKLEKLEQISYTNIMNVINLQEQLDNHIKKL